MNETLSYTIPLTKKVNYPVSMTIIVIDFDQVYTHACNTNTNTHN